MPRSSTRPSLSNQKVDVWETLARWLRIWSGRRQIEVAIDWTDFDRDVQTTLALNLVTGMAGRHRCCG